MYFRAVAFDFDGTLAEDGVVRVEVISELEKLKSSKRRVILVTGRQLDELLRIFPQTKLFDRVIAENGALIYNPKTAEEKLLAPPADAEFLRTLQRKIVAPVACGKAIIATWSPYEVEVLESIHEMGLEMQVIFNKGAVMILPSGINKATGLKAALSELGISEHNTVAVGDAENDHAMFSLSECSVAVANALPIVKAHADLVTAADHGAGVMELIRTLLDDDLASVRKQTARHQLGLGHSADGRLITFDPESARILICGPSGSGKTLLTLAMVEQLSAHGYQYCLIDPEGEYDGLPGAIVLGNSKRTPLIPDIVSTLNSGTHSVVVSLLGIPHSDRQSFFSKLSLGLRELFLNYGRPHWIVADEAHYLLSQGQDSVTVETVASTPNLLLATLHAENIETSVLKSIDVVISTGKNREDNIARFCNASGSSFPKIDSLPLSEDFLIWHRGSGFGPLLFSPIKPRHNHHRHVRKYAEGDLGNHSFFFTGGSHRTIAKAQNLLSFAMQMKAVDDNVWLYHLRRHDFSRWFRGSIQDHALANEVTMIEDDHSLSSLESRERIQLAIDRRYLNPIQSLVT